MLHTGNSTDRGLLEELERRVLLAADPLVLGTVGDDMIAVTLAASSVTVTVNGETQEFSTSGLGTLRVDGLGGNDLLTLTTAGQASSVIMRPNGSDVQGGGYSVSIANVFMQSVTGDSAVTASFYDSPGEDRWTVHADQASMSGQGYYNLAGPCAAYYAYADAGGKDTAIFYDSPGNDDFTSTPVSASISSDGHFASQSGFEYVFAYSNAGGTDTAALHDSAGNDRFLANSRYAFLAGTDFYDFVSGFDEVHAYATGANDVASLYDSRWNDTLSISPQDGTMSGQGFHNQASGFAKIHGYSASGGDDVARLYDSAGDDTFVATLDNGFMSGYNGVSWCSSAIGFGKLYAYAKAGGRDIATLYGSAGDDTFNASPTYGYMSGAGFYNYASGFEQLEGYAGEGGADKALLYGSAGDDTFIATSQWAQLAGSGYHLFSSGFANTYGNAKAGNDVAFLYDMADESGFAGSGTNYSVHEAGRTQYAVGFDDVRDLHLRPADLTYELFGPDDPNNPLSVLHMPITRAQLIVADEVIAAAGAVTDQEKIVALMKFISISREGDLGEFAWDSVAAGSPEDVLLGAVGDDDLWSMTLAGLATAKGIPLSLL